jgi:hypothetical protein
MNKSLPDKWVRKAVFDAINDIVVDTLTIPCFDSEVPEGLEVDHYVLMTTQTNTVDKSNKCEYWYESSILLDIVTSYSGVGNPGSRLLADNIADAVRSATDVLTLDAGSGLVILRQTQSFPNDVVTKTSVENIFRKFIRIELTIN